LICNDLKNALYDHFSKVFLKLTIILGFTPSISLSLSVLLF